MPVIVCKVIDFSLFKSSDINLYPNSNYISMSILSFKTCNEVIEHVELLFITSLFI